MPTIDLGRNEVLDAINSLDTYSRIWMGQFDHIDLAWRMWRFATYDGLDKHQEDLRNLVTRVAELAIIDIGKEYRSLAFERAHRGEPLTYCERRNSSLA